MVETTVEHALRLNGVGATKRITKQKILDIGIFNSRKQALKYLDIISRRLSGF